MSGHALDGPRGRPDVSFGVTYLVETAPDGGRPVTGTADVRWVLEELQLRLEWDE